MSVEMVEFARMAGVPLEPWQEDVLRRIPNEGPIRFDAFRAQRNDQRRAKEMPQLLHYGTWPAHRSKTTPV